jgi:trimeric autotransporter adhesin
MNPLIPLKNGNPLLLPAIVLACLVLLPTGQAVTPAPDGGYPNWNTAEGSGALFNLTTGGFNTAIGGQALYGNRTGNQNTAVGAFALAANNPGNQNVAVGQGVLRHNTADGNAAVGSQALYHNTTGSDNTAIGNSALFNNTSGAGNAAVGNNAIEANQTGSFNTAMGGSALGSITTGFFNTAIGYQAIAANQTGGLNTGIGWAVLANNTSGGANTALGDLALLLNRTGNDNIAFGDCAGKATTGNNNIDIGNPGDSSDSNTIRIGNSVAFEDSPCQPHVRHTATYIAGISGVAVAGDPVIVNSNGQLGVGSSSKRFKDEIKPMSDASQAILALKPVTFRYKGDLDPKRITRFGLVAEEVEKVNPDLVARDAQGKPYTVRYDAVNAMLLNEFLKAHRRMEEQDKRIEELTAQLKEQAAQIQKVSSQLEASKPAPQVVNNP